MQSEPWDEQGAPATQEPWNEQPQQTSREPWEDGTDSVPPPPAATERKGIAEDLINALADAVKQRLETPRGPAPLTDADLTRPVEWIRTDARPYQEEPPAPVAAAPADMAITPLVPQPAASYPPAPEMREAPPAQSAFEKFSFAPPTEFPNDYADLRPPEPEMRAQRPDIEQQPVLQESRAAMNNPNLTAAMERSEKFMKTRAGQLWTGVEHSIANKYIDAFYNGLGIKTDDLQRREFERLLKDDYARSDGTAATLMQLPSMATELTGMGAFGAGAIGFAGVEAASQAAGKVAYGDPFDPKAIISSYLMGMVLKHGVTPQIERVLQGGALVRTGHQLAGTAARAAQATAIDPVIEAVIGLTTGDERGFDQAMASIGPRFASNMATFMLMESSHYARAFGAGRLETMLQKVGGLTKSEARDVANIMAYQPASAGMGPALAKGEWVDGKFSIEEGKFEKPVKVKTEPELRRASEILRVAFSRKTTSEMAEIYKTMFRGYENRRRTNWEPGDARPDEKPPAPRQLGDGSAPAVVPQGTETPPIVPPVVEPPPPPRAAKSSAPVVDESNNQLVDVPVVQTAKSAIAVRPNLLQFKQVTNTTTGENDKEKLEGKKWDDTLAGTMLLWEPLHPEEFGLQPGQKFIVADGHHRLAGSDRMVRPNGKPVEGFNTQILRQADGYSVWDARVAAAEINISNGKGTIYDHVKLLRNLATAYGTDAAMERAGRLGQKARPAKTIAFNAADRPGQPGESDLLDAFINEVITPEQALAIAEMAPNDEPMQRVALRLATDGMDKQDLQNFIGSAKAEQARQQAEAQAPKQGDLFAGTDAAAVEQKMIDQAEIATQHQRQLQEQITAVRSAVKRPEIAKQMGVDVKDPAAVQKKIDALAIEMERWRKFWNHPDIMQQIRQEAGGEPIAPPADERVKPPAPAAQEPVAPPASTEIQPPAAQEPAKQPLNEKVSHFEDNLDNLLKEQPGDYAMMLPGTEQALTKVSQFRRYLEDVRALRKSGQAPNQIEALVQRELQNKATSLLEAVEAGRIDEATAQARWEKTVEQTQAAIRKADQKAKKRAESLAASAQPDLFGGQASAGQLFDKLPATALQSFAQASGMPADKATEAINGISGTLSQLAMPGMAIPYGSDTDELRNGTDGGMVSEEQARAIRAVLTGNATPADYESALGNSQRLSAFAYQQLTGKLPAYNLVGKTISTPEDLAVANQVLRNPLFESFAICITDETGKVLVSEVISIGILDQAVIDLPKCIRAVEQARRIAGKNAKLNINSSHNHPSGNTEPSAEDMGVAGTLQSMLSRYTNGGETQFLITNGKNYTVISHRFEGDQRTTEVDQYAMGENRYEKPTWEIADRQSLKHHILGPEHLKDIVTALRHGAPDAIHVLLMNTKQKIIAVIRLSEKLNGDDVISEIVSFASHNGARSAVIAFGKNQVAPESVSRTYADALKKARVNLLDVLDPQNYSYRSMGLMKANEQADRPYMALAENSETYTPAELAQQKEKALVQNAAALVVQNAKAQGITKIDAQYVQRALQKYGDKLAHLTDTITKTAGEMLSSGEADLLYEANTGKRKPVENPVDAEGKTPGSNGSGLPADDGRRAGDPGANGGAGSKQRGRKDLRLVGGYPPKPQDFVKPQQYSIDEDQRLGVNLGLQRFLGDDPERRGRGFLYGDGAGMGKTSQLLVLAHEYKKLTGKPVLVITQSDQILKGTYLSDSKRLGFNLDDFDLGTYDSLRSGHILRGIQVGVETIKLPVPAEPYGLVIFDEAHNLKNFYSKKAFVAAQFIHKADHVAFATATPMDRPVGAAYFMSEITGIPLDRVMTMMGFEMVEQEDPQTHEIRRHYKLLKGQDWKKVLENVINLREAAVSRGAIIRREFPFLGDFIDVDVEISAKDLEYEKRVKDYWDELKERSKGNNKKNMGGQKTLSLHHWVEQYKVQKALSMAAESLAAGRSVILVADYINPSDRLKRPADTVEYNGKVMKNWKAAVWDKYVSENRVIPGVIKQLEEALKKMGVTYSKVYGPGDKSAQVAKFQDNTNRAMIMTPKSGGTGINADDTRGTFPRDMIVLANIFSGDVFDQMLYRPSRRTTMSRSRIFFINAPGAFGDDTARRIRMAKLEILRRSQAGDPDKEKFDASDEVIDRNGKVKNADDAPDPEDLPPAVVKENGEYEIITGAWQNNPLVVREDAWTYGTPDQIAKPFAPGDPLPPRDDPSYTRLPLELPEMARLYRGLSGGLWPHIFHKTRKMGGGALGFFRPSTKEIFLRGDLFKIVSTAEAKNLFEKAKITAEKQATATTTPDEIAKQTQMIFEAEYRALYDSRKLTTHAMMATKVMAHELWHYVDYLPDNLMERGNILGRIKSFKGIYRENMVEIGPAFAGNMIDSAERAKMRAAAEKAAGKRPADTSSSEYKAWRQSASAIYRKDLLDLMKARGLVSREQILDELRPLIAWWRGTDTIEDYFNDKPEEMFAEAGNVLINNPAAVQARAPLFYKAWFNHYVSKPDVAEAYDRLQNTIGAGEVMRDRVLDLREHILAATLRAEQTDELARKWTKEQKVDSFLFLFNSTFGPIYRRLRKMNQPDDEAALRRSIEDYKYRHSWHELYLGDLRNRVLQPIVDANLTIMDLWEYMFHQHVINNRSDIGNPGLWTPKASNDRLEEMREQLGDRYQDLVDAQKSFRDNVRMPMVINPLRQAHIFGEKLMQDIIDREYYATISAVKNMDPEEDPNSIKSILTSTYGSNLTGHIYRQSGYCGDIRNPLIATVQKDLSLMSLIARNTLKRNIVQAFIKSDFAEEWTPAQLKWNGKYQEVVEAKGDRVGTLVYLQDGKVQAWYGPKTIIDAAQSEDPGTMKFTMRVMTAMSGFLKGLFTRWNPGFVLGFNYARDIQAFASQMPGATLVGKDSYFAYRKEALAAAKSGIRGTPDALMRQSLRRKMLITRPEQRNVDPEISPIARLMEAYGIPPNVWSETGHEPTRAWQLWRRTGDYLMEYGQVRERAVKIAAMMHLDKKTRYPEWKKREMVHVLGGSPDFLDKMGQNWLIDFFAPFIGPFERGWESFRYSFKESPGERAWKMAKYDILPALAMAAAGAGLLAWLIGDKRSKALEAMIDAIPSYDIENYHVIPLGWADQAAGKVAYIRIPMSQQDQIVHNLIMRWARSGMREMKKSMDPATPVNEAWKFDTPMHDPFQLFSVAGGQLPSVNPLATVGIAWLTYNQTGRAPYDFHYGQKIMSDDEAKADDWRAYNKLMKYSWNQVGGGIIKRFDMAPADPDQLAVEKFLKLPVIGNVLGRWVKVSSRGISERIQKSDDDLERQRARTRLDVQDMVQRERQGQPLTAGDQIILSTQPGAAAYHAALMQKSMIRGLNPEARAIFGTPGKMNRAMMAREIMQGPQRQTAPDELLAPAD